MRFGILNLETRYETPIKSRKAFQIYFLDCLLLLKIRINRQPF